METYRQRLSRILRFVNQGFATATVIEAQRTAYCECGARLAGDSDVELFDAAQSHLAQHHPNLLGALAPATVQQMAEATGA